MKPLTAWLPLILVLAILLAGLFHGLTRPPGSTPVIGPSEQGQGPREIANRKSQIANSPAPENSGIPAIAPSSQPDIRHPTSDIPWPHFRGDSRQTGRADLPAPLPADFTTAWTFRAKEELRASPVIVRDTVLIGALDNHLYALDLATGKLRWSHRAGDSIEAPAVCDGDTAYLGVADGTFLALDIATGQVRWSAQISAKITGSATLATLPDHSRAVLVGSYDSSIYCFAADSGRLKWKYTTDNYVNGSPAVTDTLAILGGCDNKLHLIRLTDGSAAGHIPLGSYVAASPAVAHDIAYVGQYAGRFFAIDLAAQQIRWTFNAGAEPIFSSPALTDDLVIFGSRNKRIYALDRATGKPRWTFTTRGQVDASPVVAPPVALCGSHDGRLYALDLATGKPVWSHRIGPPIPGTPAVAYAHGRAWIVVAAEDGSVVALSAPLR